MWERFVLLVSALAGMILLISVSLNAFKFRYEKSIFLEGNKNYIISFILKKTYSCFARYYPINRSVICNSIEFRSNSFIHSKDILNKLDTGKIKKTNIKIDELGREGKLIIKYDSGKIYIEKL